MTPMRRIPRIDRISKVDNFRVHCLFNNGEHRVVNFEKLFKEWQVKPTDTAYPLLNPTEFQKVKLRDGVLCWENIKIMLLDEDRKEKEFPYEIDPIFLYNHSTLEA